MGQKRNKGNYNKWKIEQSFNCIKMTNTYEYFCDAPKTVLRENL